MSIEIDNIETLPREIIRKLNQPDIVRLFALVTAREDIGEDARIGEIVNEIGNACRSSGLTVYHCTKEKEKGYFEKNGLIPTDPEKRVNDFLQEYGHRFGSKRRKVERILNDWLEDPRIKYRRDLISFVASKKDVLDESDNWRFLKYYGGEIIYSPLIEREDDSEFEHILESIGNPVYIEAKLDIGNINNDIDDISTLLLSFLGLFKNFSPCVSRVIRTKYAVPPENIAKVWQKHEFEEEYSQ